MPATRCRVLDLNTIAVVVESPERLQLRQLNLDPPAADELVVDIHYSGISTGTERLLWTGTMPSFPGMGYPLVPGYESIGTVTEAGPDADCDLGAMVFVPGARCYGEVRGLFGGAASRVVVPARRVVRIDENLAERGILLALAATAYNAIRAPEGGFRVPDLIVGHGVLGRLMARLSVILGEQAPMVWEINPQRRSGAIDYQISSAEDDPRTDYAAIYEVSGAGSLLDSLIGRLQPGGEVVLAGFYTQALQFSFPPAFMRRARLRVAAEWQAQDMDAVKRLAQSGELSLDGLITHKFPADQAQAAYEIAFNDPACLKMILDWRSLQ
ncbi:MAG: chlorophyll synthesis pathway protein BchC [Wenzhouxiangella sp.]